MKVIAAKGSPVALRLTRRSQPIVPVPGTTPATSQELRLNSTTATKVLAWSNAVEDFLLWSFLYDMGGQLPRVSAAEGCHAFPLAP
jgi:hypothetical protein